MQFIIDESGKKQRLDHYLAGLIPALSRSQIKRLIDSGNITVNDKSSEPSYKLKKNDKISVKIPPPEKSKIEAQEIPLNVIYEDKDILVINKKRGMTVHPGAGRRAGTLVNALLHHCKDLSGIGGVERPGIVHRLDKDTSGVLLIAKNDAAHRNLSEQFKERKISKTYLAVVSGVLKKDSGIISWPIGRHRINRKKMTVVENGRSALTKFKVIKRFQNFTMLEVKPETGRTHQIRVHLAHLGHPVAGDPIYGRKKESTPHLSVGNIPISSGQLLHAYKIKFAHPRTGEVKEFKAELPEDMLGWGER